MFMINKNTAGQYSRIGIVVSFFLIFISLPLTAAQQQERQLSIKEIKPGVFVHKSYKQVEGYGWVSSNGMVVIEENEAFIIDTPWTNHDTKSLIKWILEKKAKIVGSLSTHSHEDRAGGIRMFNALKIPTYALQRTNQILAANKKALAKNSIEKNSIEKNSKLLMNGSIQAFFPGGGHTEDNIVVWLKSSKVLFGGCFIRSIEPRSLGYTGEAKVQEWDDSINKVLSRFPTADVVIPGHGRPGNLNLLEHTQALVAKHLAEENR